MLEANYYQQLSQEKVQCLLCPQNCILSDGETGFCNARKNVSGYLYSSIFKKISSLAFDPIEKKPLYHFFPGREILSIGSYGCNLKCNFCQNYDISQVPFKNYNRFNLSTDDILLAIHTNKNNIGLAFTYNEPIIWIEYILFLTKLIDAKYKKVMVTNGYIHLQPLEDLLSVIDAFNVDLKGFTDDFYHNNTGGSLEPVKKSLKMIKQSGKHLELTNLILPTQNDNPQQFEEMVIWIAEELGKDTPLHLSRYFPRYKSAIEQTSLEVMLELFQIAEQHLDFVYLGNLHSEKGQNTYCPNCKNELISRKGYYTVITGLDEQKCSKCGFETKIIG